MHDLPEQEFSWNSQLPAVGPGDLAGFAVDQIGSAEISSVDRTPDLADQIVSFPVPAAYAVGAIVAFYPGVQQRDDFLILTEHIDSQFESDAFIFCSDDAGAGFFGDKQTAVVAAALYGDDCRIGGTPFHPG